MVSFTSWIRSAVPSSLIARMTTLRSHWRRMREIRKGPEHMFTHIYRTNAWRGAESLSGKGSDLHNTVNIRSILPEILAELGVRSILDAPCGDFHWMQHVDLEGVTYIGGDIVAPLVVENQRRFGRPGREFRHLDITKDDIPKVDLIFCRDCLFHLSFADIDAALRNFRRSGSTYVMTTTLDFSGPNVDIPTGEFRPLSLLIAPFRFPPPLRLVREEESAKHMGVWRLADIAGR